MSLALGVGQPASIAAWPIVRPKPLPLLCLAFTSFRRASHVVSEMLPTLASGVGHPVRSVPEMRRADARSRENDRPAGVADSFQVRENKVEPRPSSRAFNLLAKDRARAMLANEPEPLGPQVTLVGEAAALPGARERLARTGTGPDFALARPAGKVEGKWPTADAGEEMTGFSDGNIEGSNIDN